MANTARRVDLGMETILLLVSNSDNKVPTVTNSARSRPARPSGGTRRRSVPKSRSILSMAFRAALVGAAGKRVTGATAASLPSAGEE